MTDQPQTEAEKIQFAIDARIKLYQEQHDIYVASRARINAAVDEAKEWEDKIPDDITPEMMGVLNAYFSAFRKIAYQVLSQKFVAAYNTKFMDLKNNDPDKFETLIQTKEEMINGLESAVSASQPTMGIRSISLNEKDPLAEVKIVIIHVMADENDKVGLARDLPYDFYFNAAIAPFPTGSLREEFNSNGAVVESFTPYGSEIQPSIISYKPKTTGLKDFLFSGYIRMPGQPLQQMEFPPTYIMIGEESDLDHRMDEDSRPGDPEPS